MSMNEGWMDVSRLALSPFLGLHVVAVVKVWEGGGSSSCAQLCKATSRSRRERCLVEVCPQLQRGSGGRQCCFPCCPPLGTGKREESEDNKKAALGIPSQFLSRSPTVAKTSHI